MDQHKHYAQLFLKHPSNPSHNIFFIIICNKLKNKFKYFSLYTKAVYLFQNFSILALKNLATLFQIFNFKKIVVFGFKDFILDSEWIIPPRPI